MMIKGYLLTLDKHFFHYLFPNDNPFFNNDNQLVIPQIIDANVIYPMYHTIANFFNCNTSLVSLICLLNYSFSVDNLQADHDLNASVLQLANKLTFTANEFGQHD